MIRTDGSGTVVLTSTAASGTVGSLTSGESCGGKLVDDATIAGIVAGVEASARVADDDAHAESATSPAPHHAVRRAKTMCSHIQCPRPPTNRISLTVTLDRSLWHVSCRARGPIRARRLAHRADPASVPGTDGVGLLGLNLSKANLPLDVDVRRQTSGDWSLHP